MLTLSWLHLKVCGLYYSVWTLISNDIFNLFSCALDTKLYTLPLPMSHIVMNVTLMAVILCDWFRNFLGFLYIIY